MPIIDFTCGIKKIHPSNFPISQYKWRKNMKSDIIQNKRLQKFFDF